MLQSIIIAGLILITFLVADFIQLHGFGYVIGAIYLAACGPLLIVEIVKLFRK